ncbi:MAG: hypothetical protein ACYTAN_09680 [Planctomycetota bacterium]|jgi:hypothetical protein
MPKTKYGGWPNCIALANDQVELVVTTDVGPRIIRLAFVGGENLLKEFPEQMGKTGGDDWRPYGGHRFWHAPEVIPRTYAPDNDPVEATEKGTTVRLVQPVERTTGMQKELEISLDPKRGHVSVLHRLTNHNRPHRHGAGRGGGLSAGAVQAAPRVHASRAPACPVALHRYERPAPDLRQDPKAETKNKIGMLNCQGWAAYLLKGCVFVKRFPCVKGAPYPDFGCNCESYTDPDILEIESLGPLSTIEPECSVEYIEDWYLFKAEIDLDEKSFDEKLMPLITGALG